MLINMVRAITTRSRMRKTLTVEGTKKQPPPRTDLNKDNTPRTEVSKETKKQPSLRTDLNKDNTPRTEVSKETTSNSCEDNPKDTSIKEMHSTDPFCKCIMKRLLNKTAPKHELNTFFIHNGLLYRYASDHSRDFCALVIPKA